MCKQERLITKFNEKTNRYQTIKVTCGKCVECLQQRRNSWGKRTELEMYSNGMLRYKHAYLITLTYSNLHIPRDSRGNYTLRLKQVQMYIDRLRSHHKLRYLICGEYGGRTHRPHYHLLIVTDDLITRHEYDTQWQLGYIDYQEVKHSLTDIVKTARYISKYIAKGECDSKDVLDFTAYRKALRDYLPPDLKHVRKPELYINEIRAHYPILREVRLNIIEQNLDKCHQLLMQRLDLPRDLEDPEYIDLQDFEYHDEDPTQLKYDWHIEPEYYLNNEFTRTYFSLENYESYLLDIKTMYENDKTFDDIFFDLWTSFETPFVRASQNWGYNPLNYTALNDIPISDIPLDEFIQFVDFENPYSAYLEHSYTDEQINLLLSTVSYEIRTENQTNVARLALPGYLRAKIIAEFPVAEAAIRSLTTDSIIKSVEDFRQRIRDVIVSVPIDEVNETINKIVTDSYKQALAKYKKQISSNISFGE